MAAITKVVRQRFERWAKSQGYELKHGLACPTQYFWDNTQRAYEAWKAGRRSVRSRQSPNGSGDK